MFRKLYFDKEDHKLLRMINEAIDSGSNLEQRFFDASLHPHGIVELTTTHEFRVAHAVINLLGSLELGQAEDRLLALRTLHDEVLHSAQTPFRYNTGRVLIQIMKDIVRSRHEEETQLQLVHGFRRAAKGNPRVIRSFLKKYMLLEMPEDWNQLTLDHHVHDAHTKGRKNSTHLIMDAWVKGIRYLTVIYYNYVEPKAARELLQAAKIMGINVRIGLEFRAHFRGHYVNLVWAPRGFSNPEDFLNFMAERPVMTLMQEGRKASLYHTQYVLGLLDNWNHIHKPILEAELGFEPNTWPELTEEGFLTFVGSGQASSLHLAELIHKTILPFLKSRAKELQLELANLAPSDQTAHDTIINTLNRLNTLIPESILEGWFRPSKNTNLPSPATPIFGKGVPDILTLTPHVLLDWLTSLRSGYRVILQLADLNALDVLELLWDCQGMITHLELFNMKEWHEGNLKHIKEINELQHAINEGSALALKHILRSMIQQLDEEANSDSPNSSVCLERCEKFRIILRNIPTLQAPYKIAPLSERFGTDSTSHSSLRHGMGLAVVDSLPPGVCNAAAKHNFRIFNLPICVDVTFQENFTQPKRPNKLLAYIRLKLRYIPGLNTLGLLKTTQWKIISSTATVTKQGNIIALGGLAGASDNGLLNNHEKSKPKLTLSHLNTNVSNMLKVLLGFIPAAITFYYTQTDWFLIYFGAVIWFAITGVRNIIQAILGGGGIHHRSMLRWRNLVDWSRISDSLLYTGLSVLLLEWIIRSTLLQNTFNITVDNHPTLVFSIIAVANGIYISLHNIYRGFPKEAIIGNLFRSALAIPISILYYDLLLFYVTYFEIAGGLILLQQGAAITSKTASDTVAGLIEGIADRRNNIRLRFWDYKTKLDQFFKCYAKLELAFPDRDIFTLLIKPKEFMRLTDEEAKSLQTESIINALDLMYFWLYQPYAQQTLIAMLRGMTKEERLILARAQNILVRFREVSQLFVDGLLGKDFAQALSFYLTQHEVYIINLNRHCKINE